jgi:osmotically-inducible protein OsmY
MNKNIPSGNFIRRYVFPFMIIASIIACNPYERDRQIKIDISAKAKNDVNFAGVNFTVKNGIVTLSGNCPTSKSQAEVNQALKTIHILDSINDKIKISPVTLGSSLAMKRSVDSVLANYPAVNAAVTDTSVVLMGSLKSKESTKLMDDINKINTGTTVNRLTINNL